MKRGGAVCSSLLLMLFIGLTVRAGNPIEDRPVRVEIPAKSTNETYRVLPVANNAILLFFRSVETVGDSLTKWYFSLYDRDLKPVWIKSISIKTGLDAKDSYLAGDTLNLLFLPGDKNKGSAGLGAIVRIDTKSGSFRGTRVTLPQNLQPIGFRVVNNMCMFGYNTRNEPARIAFADPESGRTSAWSLSPSQSQSTLTDFIADSLNNIIYAVTRQPVLKSRPAFFLVKMNFEGSVISQTEILTNSDQWELVNPMLIMLSPNEILVVSTFATAGHTKPGSFTGSSGFYTCKFNNGVQSDIRFKNFLDLSNFQSMIGDKDMDALKKKASRKNKSLTEFAPEINLLVHPLKLTGDQILFMGEKFAPEYHPENFTEFDFYGRPYIVTYNVFDGYRYSGAIIASFDRNGNLKWDNSMVIGNLVSPDLSPRVSAWTTSADTIVMCYSGESRIASKIIHHNEVIEKIGFSALDPLYPEDKVLTESKNNMIPWYGPYFLCYGYQEIKNINSSEDKKRLVFYITKVRFD